MTREAAIRSARSASKTHSRTLEKRGASTIARAVPQLPAPMTARFFTTSGPRTRRRFRCPPRSRSDITTMSVDNKRSAEDRRRLHRERGQLDQPDRQGKDRRPDDRPHRDVPGPGHHCHEDHHHRGQRPRRQAQERPDDAGHRLAALKLQKHRISMAEHHRHRRGAHGPGACAPSACPPATPPGIPCRYRAAGSRRPPRGRWSAARWSRRYCRCPCERISDAGLPVHQQVSERNGAEQVGNRHNKKRHHHFESGNSASLVYTEPVGRNWLRYRKKAAAVKLPKSSEARAAIVSRSGCRSSFSLMRASVRCGE